MGNNNLIEKNQPSFFSKIKNWFKGLFGKKENDVVESGNELEFNSQKNVQDDNMVDFEKAQNNNIQYQFSGSGVSKQKIEKIRFDLDNGKIGIDSLYQLSEDEIKELGKVYDDQINDSISKINEVETSINNYKRRLAKIQN